MAEKSAALRNTLTLAFAGAFTAENAQVISANIEIYDSDDVLLLSVKLPKTNTWDLVTTGTLSANGFPKDIDAITTGVASKAKILTYGGSFWVEWLTVGETNAHVIVDDVNFVGGNPVRINSVSWVVPAGIADPDISP